MIGAGATGAVYRARHPGGHAVAVKILDQSLMASAIAQRFVRESQLMMSMHHPNVVRPLAAGKDEKLNVLYLAMPLLQGEDLEKIIERQGALDPTAAVRITIQAAQGIAAAHRLGVVHRDIKPGNLFIDQAADGRLAVRVCDFGIAKSSFSGGKGDSGITQTGSQLGTPDYISPEQLKDSKSVDSRADLWGLGATLYELLSGNPPFAHHEAVFDVVSAILSEDVRWLQDTAPWVDAELAAIVARTLRRNPSERFPDMEAFADALLPHAHGDATLTRAALVSVSPILRKVKKARPERPPAPQNTAPRTKRPSDTGPTTPQPKAPPLAPANAREALLDPAPKQHRAPGSSSRRKPPRSNGALRLFSTLLLLAVATGATLIWLGLVDPKDLLDALKSRIHELTDP